MVATEEGKENKKLWLLLKISLFPNVVLNFPNSFIPYSLRFFTAVPQTDLVRLSASTSRSEPVRSSLDQCDQSQLGTVGSQSLL